MSTDMDEPEIGRSAISDDEGAIGQLALADDPLFDGSPGEYIPEPMAAFDYYEPGDLRCPLDDAPFSEWRGYDGPCESAHIVPGRTAAMVPSLSFEEGGAAEEIPIELPACFYLVAHHDVGALGEHTLEARGECDSDGIWRSTSPFRAWVWSEPGQRLGRVVWAAAGS